MDTKWKRAKVKMTPALVQKILEYVRQPSTTPEDVANVVARIHWYAKHGCETLTTEEFDEVIKKSA
jgi:hypothetical protein